MIRIIPELTAIVLLGVLFLPFYYQEKLARYLKNNRPTIYRQVTPNPNLPRYVSRLLPIEYFNINIIELTKYILKEHPQDNERTRRYKKALVISFTISCLVVIAYLVDAYTNRGGFI